MTPSPATPWRLELSRDAEQSVRSARPVSRGAVVTLLDRLAREGLPRDAVSLEDHDTWRITDPAGVLVVARRREERVLLVVSLAHVEEAPVRDALRLAHLPAAVASRVSEHLIEVGSDVRFALRTFRKRPGFVASVLATLALAIGGTSALFGLINTVFLSALPFEEGDRLLRLRDESVTPSGQVRHFNMSPLNFHAIVERNRVFSGVVAQGGVNLALTGGDVPQRVNGIRVTAGWTEVMGLRPLLGRGFTPEEEARGADAGAAILAHSLWESRYGSDPSVIGREVTYDGGRFSVVGVMSPRFNYPYDAELWMPWTLDATDGLSHDFNVVGRLLPGATLEEARRDLDRIALELESERPDTNAELGLYAETVREDFIEGSDRILVALMASVAFLLLLACVNVTNLLVARFVSRQQEIGIRAALGASRMRQLRQFATETLVLFVLGGAAGLMLTLWLGNALSVLIPENFRTQLDMAGVRLDANVLAFTALLSVGAGLVFGLLAAVRGSRTDVVSVLKDGGRGTAGRNRVQHVLVVTELALSLTLLAGAGVLFDHFQRLRSDDLGLDIAGLYTVRVSLEQERYQEPEARVAAVSRLREAVAAVPGVEAVGMTTVNPLCCGDWGAPLEVDGFEPLAEGATILIHHRLVGPAYFEATGTELLSGRVFGAQDGPGSPQTVIVDESLAKRFWPGEEALGKRVRVARPGREWRTVVGVVGDVQERGDYSDTWYIPYAQNATDRSAENLHFMIRTASATTLEAVRQAVGEVDPNLPVYGTSTMGDLRTEIISQERLGAIVAGVFAVVGLLLAAFGLFGVLSYAVSTRRREIGTRIALGAERVDVVAMILRQALALSAVGATVGLGTALGLNRLLQSLVAGTRPAGPGMLAIITVTLVLAATLAAAAPAMRAARVDPLTALKE